MPNCFNLTRKGEKEPANLFRVDEEICEYMGMPVDENKWCCSWYDTIGFSIAMGKDVAWMRSEFENENVLKILDYLEAHYRFDSWAEIGR